MFLSDQQVVAMLALHPNLIENLVSSPADRSDSQIQPASIDLRIGQIFLPGAKPGELGSADAPLTSRLSLKTGQTAVVATFERCNFPESIGAIAFPPSVVSADGLLMTNPGHIDPGYEGALTFTVINMGRAPYELKRLAPIVTMLLFELDQPPLRDYAARHPGRNVAASAVNQELLGQLSPDFLNVDERATKAGEVAAESAEQKTRRYAVMLSAIPVLASVTALLLSWSPWSSGQTAQVDRVEQRVSVLEASQGVAALNGQLRVVQRQVRMLQRERNRSLHHRRHA